MQRTTFALLAIAAALVLSACPRQRACELGDWRCHDNRAQTCDVSGAWVTYQDCDETTRPGVCFQPTQFGPGAPYCVDATGAVE